MPAVEKGFKLLVEGGLVEGAKCEEFLLFKLITGIIDKFRLKISGKKLPE